MKIYEKSWTTFHNFVMTEQTLLMDQDVLIQQIWTNFMQLNLNRMTCENVAGDITNTITILVGNQWRVKMCSCTVTEQSCYRVSELLRTGRVRTVRRFVYNSSRCTSKKGYKSSSRSFETSVFFVVVKVTGMWIFLAACRELYAA